MALTLTNDKVNLYIIKVGEDGYLGRVFQLGKDMMRSALSFDYIILPDIISVERRFPRNEQGWEQRDINLALKNIPTNRAHICTLKWWRASDANKIIAELQANRNQCYWSFDAPELPHTQITKLGRRFTDIKLSVAEIQLTWTQPHTAKLTGKNLTR